MSLKIRLIFMIMKTPGLRSIYSKFRPTLWGYGSRSTYREDFIEFVAQRRNMEMETARSLVMHAENRIAGGWGGDKYRNLTELLEEMFRPLYDDVTDKEVIETYKFHGPTDFLRMLGYSIPDEQDVEPILSRLSKRQAVSIVDYGCGLAHRTIAVSKYLIRRGIKVKLYLVDIRRELHFSFLSFLCRKYHIDHEFIEITSEHLYPALPQHDYCDNVSVLEHIREPLTVVNNTDRGLRSGGLFLVLADDAIEEMMHITPNLKVVRNRLAELHYQKVGVCYETPLFQKPTA